MKKSLTQAIALATLVGAAATAQATNINQDGHGDVLLYPVFTAENSNNTLVSVTNTTNKYKAVKVRFLEGMNSAEVLDFNLYLSPQDVWTGAVVATADGAKLVSSDTSCISAHPNGFPAAGMPFRNYVYSGDNDKGFNGLERTRIGHIEVIEMGVVDPTLVIGNGSTTATAGKAIKHVNGVPGNCAAVHAAWTTGGTWDVEQQKGIDVPTGGLYGTASIINVAGGWQASYDATAIDNWGINTVHSVPGDTFPNLGQGSELAVFKNGTELEGDTSWDSVTAILMKESIQNDYVVGAGLNAETDFVVTFPTKRQFVNVAAGDPAAAPFTNVWNKKTAKACEAIDVTYYDREEHSQVLNLDQVSPRPPAAEGLSLCYETNVLHIGKSNVLGGEFVGTEFALGNGFESGWMNIGLVKNGNTDRVFEIDGENIKGLPVVGFAATVIQNGDVGGLLSNYATAYDHKATTTMDH